MADFYFYDYIIAEADNEEHLKKSVFFFARKNLHIKLKKRGNDNS